MLQRGTESETKETQNVFSSEAVLSGKLNDEGYLNIWVVQTVSGAAAYTYRPYWAHSQPNNDGIIAIYSYFYLGEQEFYKNFQSHL